METVYHSILKGFNWILAGLLSLLGFSVTSCGATDEYGSPYAESVSYTHLTLPTN